MANLPVVIFQFAMSPYKDWQQLAWSGALLITFSILVLSILARVVVSALDSGKGRSLMETTEAAVLPDAKSAPPEASPAKLRGSRTWTSTTAKSGR